MTGQAIGPDVRGGAFPPAVSPTARTLIARASRIIAAPMVDDDAQAAADIAIVLHAHRAGVFTTQCRACGQTVACGARVEAMRRQVQLNARIAARPITPRHLRR